MYSPNYTLIKHDLKKIGIGALMAMLGGLATFMEMNLMDSLKEMLINSPQLLLFAQAINSIAINAIRKFIKQTDY